MLPSGHIFARGRGYVRPRATIWRDASLHIRARTAHFERIFRRSRTYSTTPGTREMTMMATMTSFRFS